MTPPLSPPPRSDFALNGSIGTGHSNRGDVLKLRRALQKTGHGRFPRTPAPNVTPGLMEAIEGFQRDFGLEPDGVLEPGGPTEATLRIALTALDADGARGLATVREHFEDRARAGLTFRPDPEDPLGARWRDQRGAELSDEQAAQRAGNGSGGTQTAMMRRRDGVLGRQNQILEGGAGGFSRGSIGAGFTLRAIMNQMLREASGEVSRPSGPSGENIQGRTVPATNFPPGIPPFPAEPPELPPEHDDPPDENLRGPTILVNPIPEERSIQIEVYPDMSDEFERWLVLENGRGTPEGQQADLQFIIDKLYGAFIRKGIEFEHTHGGLRGKETPIEKPGDYLKERVLQLVPHQNKDSRRSDFTVKTSQTGETDDINVVDALKDRVTPAARERRAASALVELKKKADAAGGMYTIGKSKGMDWEEWKKMVEVWIEEYTDAKLDSIRALKKKDETKE